MHKQKYRVWCKNNKEWEKDLCVLTPDGMLFQISSKKWPNSIAMMPCRPETHIVQLFTGLCDKNGNEIYEGDFLKNLSGRICQVVWFQSPCFVGWDLKALNGKGNPPPRHNIWGEWEIIGNVHENPELLKEES